MRSKFRILCCIIGCALSTLATRANKDAFGLCHNKAARTVHQTIEAFRQSNHGRLIPMMNEVEQDTTILQSWNFRIPVKRTEKAAPREIQRLTGAFQAVQQDASSFVSRGKLPENTPFSDVRAIYGQGKTIKCAFTDEMNIHSMVFEDTHSACNSFILSWWTAGHTSPDSLWLEGFIYECYGHSLYMKPDTPLPAMEYNPITGRRIPDGTFREYIALRSKISHMLTRAQVADSTEMAAIVLALEKEIPTYDISFFQDQYQDISEQIRKLSELAKPFSSELIYRCLKTISHINSISLLPYHNEITNSEKEFLSQYGIQLYTLTIRQGEHYLGNPRIPYIERIKGSDLSSSDWTATRRNLPNGMYRLKMAVRGESDLWGTSLYITVKWASNSDMMTRTMYQLHGCGYTGGNIWAQAKAEVEKAKAEGREPSPTDLQIAQANGGRGYGWNWLIVDNIEINGDYHNNYLQFGVVNNLQRDDNRSRDSDGNCFSYSICDFVLERTGDLP